MKSTQEFEILKKENEFYFQKRKLMKIITFSPFFETIKKLITDCFFSDE